MPALMRIVLVILLAAGSVQSFWLARLLRRERAFVAMLAERDRQIDYLSRLASGYSTFALLWARTSNSGLPPEEAERVLDSMIKKQAILTAESP